MNRPTAPIAALPAAVLLAAALLAAAVGLGRGGAVPPGGVLARPAPGVIGAARALDEPGAREVLAGLDAARAAGFAAPGSADVGAWADTACPCAAADAAALRRFAAAGRALRGARAELASVRVVRSGSGTAELLVTDRLPAYDEVTGSGVVVHRWPGRGRRSWRVTLVAGAAGWRVLEVAAAGPARPPDRLSAWTERPSGSTMIGQRRAPVPHAWRGG